MDPKKKWQRTIDESGGQLTWMPEELLKKWEAIEEERKNFNEKANELSKKEIVLKAKQVEFFLEMRYKLEEKDPEIWSKDVNMLSEALSDGCHIVHTVRPPGVK